MNGAPSRSLVVASWAVLYGYFLLGGLVEGAYQGLDLEPPGDLFALQRAALFAAISAWLSAYALKHGVPLPMDAGMFAYAASAVVVPYYIFRAEGRRGWVTLAAVVGAVVGAVGVQWTTASVLRAAL